MVFFAKRSRPSASRKNVPSIQKNHVGKGKHLRHTLWGRSITSPPGQTSPKVSAPSLCPSRFRMRSTAEFNIRCPSQVLHSPPDGFGVFTEFDPPVGAAVSDGATVPFCCLPESGSCWALDACWPADGGGPMLPSREASLSYRLAERDDFSSTRPLDAL